MHHPPTVHRFAVNKARETKLEELKLKTGCSHGYSGSLGFVLRGGGCGVKVLIVRPSLVVLGVLVSHHEVHVNLELIASELAVVVASISCLSVYIGLVVCSKRRTSFWQGDGGVVRCRQARQTQAEGRMTPTQRKAWRNTSLVEQKNTRRSHTRCG